MDVHIHSRDEQMIQMKKTVLVCVIIGLLILSGSFFQEKPSFILIKNNLKKTLVYNSKEVHEEKEASKRHEKLIETIWKQHWKMEQKKLHTEVDEHHKN